MAFASELRVAIRSLLDGETLGTQLGFGEPFGVPPEEDVDAPAGHVRGDGHAVRTAGLGDDVRLPFVLLGVQHRMGDATLVEQPGEELRLLHGDGADEDGLTLLVALLRCRRPPR